MEFLDTATMMGFLSEAGKSSMVEKLFIVACIWYIMKQTVSSHFKKVEDSLALVATNIKELKESLLKVESSHSARLNVVEERITKLETKE